MIFKSWKWASFITIIWFFYSKSFKNSFLLMILFFHLVRLFVNFNINYQSNPHCHYLNLNLGLNPWYYWKGPTYLSLTYIWKDLFIIQHRGLISLIFYPIDDMGANSGLKHFIPQGNFWVLLIWSTRPGLKVHFVTFFSYHRIKKLLLQKVFVFLSNRIICRKKIKNDIHFVTKGSFRHFFV